MTEDPEELVTEVDKGTPGWVTDEDPEELVTEADKGTTGWMTEDPEESVTEGTTG